MKVKPNNPLGKRVKTPKPKRTKGQRIDAYIRKARTLQNVDKSKGED